MGFWCLSSEVVFREIAMKAKSIILTSGTLSPVNKALFTFSYTLVDGYFCFGA